MRKRVKSTTVLSLSLVPSS